MLIQPTKAKRRVDDALMLVSTRLRHQGGTGVRRHTPCAVVLSKGIWERLHVTFQRAS
jgi:hypothetical protein